MLLAATSAAQRNAAQQAWPVGYYEQEARTQRYHEQEADTAEDNEQEAKLVESEKEWHTRADACVRHSSVLQEP